MFLMPDGPPGSQPFPESQLPPTAAPQPVSGLSMTSDGKILTISWAPPSGHWESYNILLNNGSHVLVNQTISRASTQLAFSSLGIGLVPGHLYEARVTVQSGSLNSTARCYGRLSQSAFTAHLCGALGWAKTLSLFDIPWSSSSTSRPAAGCPPH